MKETGSGEGYEQISGEQTNNESAFSVELGKLLESIAEAYLESQQQISVKDVEQIEEVEVPDIGATLLLEIPVQQLEEVDVGEVAHADLSIYVEELNDVGQPAVLDTWDSLLAITLDRIQHWQMLPGQQSVCPEDAVDEANETIAKIRRQWIELANYSFGVDGSTTSRHRHDLPGIAYRDCVGCILDALRVARATKQPLPDNIAGAVIQLILQHPNLL